MYSPCSWCLRGTEMSPPIPCPQDARNSASHRRDTKHCPGQTEVVSRIRVPVLWGLELQGVCLPSPGEKTRLRPFLGWQVPSAWAPEPQTTSQQGPKTSGDRPTAYRWKNRNSGRRTCGESETNLADLKSWGPCPELRPLDLISSSQSAVFPSLCMALSWAMSKR